MQLRFYVLTKSALASAGLLLLIIGTCIPLYSNSELSTVRINGFSEKIYHERHSDFILSSSDSSFSIPETPFQKPGKISSAGSKSIIKITTGQNASYKIPAASKYIQNTRYLNLESNEIRKIKKRFINSKNIIRDVENFVYNHIDKKITGIPIMPARDIFRNRTGDCTEHAILAIAILRSCKIPSRASVGMVLCKNFGDANDVFVFHMWAEAFYNGKWHIVDATRPGSRFPNRYIAFSYHHLKTAMPLSYLTAIAAIKDLSVEYVNNN